jgi:uncharacterized membrane protein YedE/YeeE
MSLIQIALLGSIIGIPLGYILQRTKLCFNSAYREAILNKNLVLVRMIVTAILVQLVGLAILIQFKVGGISTNIVPFYWLAAIIGGFIFGISMVYAEGCSSTIWYRVGNGNLGAFVTLVGFGISEWTLRFGPFRDFLGTMHGYEVTLQGGEPATLPNTLGLTPWLVVIPLALVSILWLRRAPAGSYLGGWDWRKGGLLLGVIGVLAWVASWPTDWKYGVGVVGATGEFIQTLFKGPNVLNWGSFLVLTMPLGAFIAAWLKRELRLQVPDRPSTIRMLVSGMAMGFGATLAGGCNIGHGFSGLPTLAMSSLTATLFTFVGAWLGNYLRFMRHMRA